MGTGRDMAKGNRLCQICNCKPAENRYLLKQVYVPQIFTIDENLKGIKKKKKKAGRQHSYIIKATMTISGL